MNEPEPHMREWGEGERIALPAESWWRPGPELALRGYRVLAPDLPGHGLSPHRAAYGWRELAVRTVAGAGHVIHNDDFEGFLAAVEDRL